MNGVCCGSFRSDLYRPVRGGVLIFFVSVLMYLFIFEMVFCGPIGLVMAGFSIRKIIFCMLVSVAGVSLFFDKGFIFIKIIMLCCFWGLLFWGVGVPLVRGVNMADALSESASVVYLLAIIPLSVLGRRFGIHRYLSFFNVCIAIVSAFIVFSWLMAAFFGIDEFGFLLRTILVSLSGNDSGIFIGPMPDGSFRVMWIICIFYPFLIFWVNREKLNYPMTAFYLFASYASGTRAVLYVSIFVFLYFLFRSYPKFTIAVTIISIALLLLSASSLTEIRVLDVASDFDPSSARGAQFYGLMRLWARFLLFGAGLGAHADIVRSDALYSYELTYVALLSKIGLAGVMYLFVMLFVLFKKVFCYWRKKRTEILILFLGFIFITATNPYLFNAFGFCLFSVLVWIGCYGLYRFDIVDDDLFCDLPR